MKQLLTCFAGHPCTRRVGRRLAPLYDVTAVVAAVDAVNAWSVNGSSLNSGDLASSLFAASLFPYLVLLFFLSRPATGTPKLVSFGFQFLLVFVFATIPAGIYAKVHFHDVLANVDWLHGSAESLLTVTNTLIIFGFRQTRTQRADQSNEEAFLFRQVKGEQLNKARDWLLPLLLLLPALGAHTPEPLNALTIPTWAVHTSSIMEWLIAMELAWEHSFTSGNPRWRGMTVAMMLSHLSGMAACTFHFFYNNPSLSWVVSLQALTTVLGNSAMALAAYRIWRYGDEQAAEVTAAKQNNQLYTDLKSNDFDFLSNLFSKTILLAVLVKFGELYLPAASSAAPNPHVVLACMLVPVGVNAAYWALKDAEERGGFVFAQTRSGDVV